MIGNFVVFEPFYSLAHLPHSAALLAFFDVDASSVLLALIPLSLVAATIGPCEGTVAMFLVILVLADVLTAVAPREDALTFHSIVNPIALEYSTVGPDVLADTMDVVLLEVTVVGALVAPNELSSAVLHALYIFT